jgi:hypothetical protein
VSEVTLFWTLYNAGVNGDFEAFADLIDDECAYVMVPTMEVSRGKPVVHHPRSVSPHGVAASSAPAATP